MKTFKELLLKFPNGDKACSDAIIWSEDKTIEEIVKTVHRGDWLLWLARTIDLDIRPLTLAKARCAKTVIHLMKDQRSIDAVNIAEKFGLGECTLEELHTASRAAHDASYSSCAAYAAYAATADAATARAAVYASEAATDRTENQLQTADICREILGQLIIDKVNEILIK